MPLSAEDKLLLERLENDFVYHAPKDDQAARYEILRGEALVFARLIVRSCPDGRERSLALSKLEEVIFWSNAAIARSQTE